MSKYLNVFNTLAEYQAFSASTEYVQPNVALVKETNTLYYDYGDNKPHPNYTDYKVSSRSLVSDGGDTYGLDETLCLNYIPSGVTDMSYTFKYCTSLKEVTFLPTTPPSYNKGHLFPLPRLHLAEHIQWIQKRLGILQGY